MAQSRLSAFYFAGLLLASSTFASGQETTQVPHLEWTDAKRSVTAEVDRLGERLTAASTEIWQHAELALRESKSSALLANTLEEGGFQLERGVAEMPTAWVASYGEGKPVVAFLAEFDALPGLSQTVSAKVEARIPGAGGHGCGHNLFGVGSVGAGLALKKAMQDNNLPGTIRVYGTPAEEQGIGKVWMVRDGMFDDVDVCLSWHPSNANEVSLTPSKALRSFEVTFYGRSAHAAGAPWSGVSALDAVEAFETGVNLLREHMPESARIHYVVTNGGAAPNIVPSQASVWLFTRGKDWPEQELVYRHVMKIVEGADLMAWGEEHGQAESGFQPAYVQNLTGLYHYNPNLPAAIQMYANLALVGPAEYTEADHVFARELQTAFKIEAQGMHTELTPFDPNAAPEPGGSTDVANISWVCPTIGLGVANWPMDVPAHSWASTAASGSPAAFKAMLVASKVLACAGVDVLTNPKLVADAHSAFEKSSATFPYVSPVGADEHPSLPSSMRGE
ncbi:MAG: aminobenzoyl-glutamate utilization protein B [Candidatus Paceibacteria bacterium]|jgi:aminobenzoyl-glutamate utilization protein B